jgi:hypothetical protein
MVCISRYELVRHRTWSAVLPYMASRSKSCLTSRITVRWSDEMRDREAERQQPRVNRVKAAAAMLN